MLTRFLKFQFSREFFSSCFLHQPKTRLNFLFFFFSDSEISISLPLNARSIVVKMLAPSVSRLQLTDPKSKANFLKDNHVGEVDVGGTIALITLPEAKREEIYIQGPLKMELLLHADYDTRHPIKIFYQFSKMKEPEEKLLENVTTKERVDGPFMWDYLAPDGQCNARCDSGSQQIQAVSFKP